MKQSKPWDRFRVLELVGQVVDITAGSTEIKSVYLENLQLSKTQDGRDMALFITNRGAGGQGYIRSRGMVIVSTGEKPTLREATVTVGRVGATEKKDYKLRKLAGDIQ